ncbi:hypothetical protein KM043_003490 [Ampulex compressa]|nr:hypothetical protein KM043_003490 [Ampulex compressa]
MISEEISKARHPEEPRKAHQLNGEWRKIADESSGGAIVESSPLTQFNEDQRPRLETRTGQKQFGTIASKSFVCPRGVIEQFVRDMRLIILLVFAGMCAAAPQFFLRPATMFAHPAVVINSAIEDSLPNELRNNFYKNPNIASRLAKESWFIDKEMHVIDRESDKIPREKIYSVLHNAGLARKR